jgi:D-3-phosphoglycerate dehydrogenase
MRAVIPYDPNIAPYDYEQHRLASLGVNLQFCDQSEAGMVAAAADAEILFNNGNALSAAGLRQLRSCLLISFYGIGVDAVDVAAATELGIVVANAPLFGVEEVAEHALALLLACSRRLWQADRLVRDGGWDAAPLRPLRSLRGRTVGIVGFGNIGRALARKLLALGCDVLYCDPYVPEPPFPGPRSVTLHELLGAADFVSINAPRTPETTGLIGEPELARMKPSAFLVNTARGSIVQEAALARALHEGRIAGAALDVFAVEPLPLDSPLRDLPNVLLTPHIASMTEEAWARLKQEVCDAVECLVRGQWPRYVVNPAVRPRANLPSRA